MWQGEGAPQIVYIAVSGNRTIISLPRPVKDGRVEEYDDSEMKRYTNLRGKLKDGKPFIRFTATYTFGNLDTDMINDIITLYNFTKTITWIPYSDFPWINYECKWKPMPKLHHGTVSRDSLVITVKSVGDVGKIPTLDNMLAVVMFGRIFKVKTIHLK